MLTYCPEIALTSQIVERLQRVFGDEVGVYHSRFSDSETGGSIKMRLKENREKQYKLILGVRSAFFLPFDNLGLIIVDEEHENTFKQYDPAPRYHARDAAVILASLGMAQSADGYRHPCHRNLHQCSKP